MTSAPGSTKCSSRGVAIARPSIALSTEIAGVMKPSPKNSAAPNTPTALTGAHNRQLLLALDSNVLSASTPPSPRLSARSTMRDVLDRDDQHERPENQRQQADDVGLRDGDAVLGIEALAERVQRAGADVAEDYAEGRDDELAVGIAASVRDGSGRRAGVHGARIVHVGRALARLAGGVGLKPDLQPPGRLTRRLTPASGRSRRRDRRRAPPSRSGGPARNCPCRTRRHFARSACASRPHRPATSESPNASATPATTPGRMNSNARRQPRASACKFCCNSCSRRRRASARLASSISSSCAKIFASNAASSARRGAALRRLLSSSRSSSARARHSAQSAM